MSYLPTPFFSTDITKDFLTDVRLNFLAPIAGGLLLFFFFPGLCPLLGFFFGAIVGLHACVVHSKTVSEALHFVEVVDGVLGLLVRFDHSFVLLPSSYPRCYSSITALQPSLLPSQCPRALIGHIFPPIQGQEHRTAASTFGAETV